MRIDEISSQDLRQNHHESHPPQNQLDLILSRIESSIKLTENPPPAKPLPVTISDDLRRYLNQLSQLAPLQNSVKILLWKLSYRLWNACVDLSNTASIRSRSPQPQISSNPEESIAAEDNARLRHVAADILHIAGAVAGIPSPEFKSASFYHKTGAIWYELRRFELASACFERASDLVSKFDADSVSDAADRKLLLDLSLGRARTAWEVPTERNLAAAFLSRAKSLLFGSAEHYRTVADQYLAFGKRILSEKKKNVNDSDGLSEALRLMNEALDLYEKGSRAARTREDMVDLREMKVKTLRFISAVHLQMGEFEGVLKCVKVLREGESDDRHPSLPVLAMKAWLGLRHYAEAEKELRGMVVNKGVPEGVWVSAVEDYFQAAGTAGAETAKEVFLGLLGRCHVSAGAAVRVAHRVVGSAVGEGSKVRAKVVAELVSDQRVTALFSSEAVAKQRTAMHAVLWNCAADHFRSKDYETSAEMFEKAMLYIPYDVENRTLRAKGYRVLCLCHLGLARLDQALEYINEAEKLDPAIASAFLKFKIYLQKNDQNGAINQVQAMTTCLDFNPDFLSLSAHEAIACHVLPVAVAALSNLLKLYVSGKSMPTTEIIVLRTLVTILSQEPGNEQEVLKFLKLALTRASEIGPDCFFGKGEIGKREWNWFAGSSWNFGIKSGKETNFQLCSEFLRLSSEFYSLPLNHTPEEENNVLVCKSLILAVSAIIASENKTKIALTDIEVKKTAELLDRAGKLLKSTDQVTSFDPELYFVYTNCGFDLQGRLNDPASQLHLVKSFASSKACSSDPKYLLQIGLDASQGPRSNHEAASFALNECLSALLASQQPDYQTVALITRKLIAVANFRRGDSDDDDKDETVYGIYRRAYRIMVGLKEGEFPAEEGKWLATTAWNRAALPVRLGRVDVAKKWMGVGLELATRVPGMDSYRASMEGFVGCFENELGAQNIGGKNMPQCV